MNSINFYYLILINIFGILHLNCAIDFESNVNFIFYNKSDSTPYFQSNSIYDNLTDAINCKPNGKLSIIVHGWTESCKTEWVLDLIDNLREYRGGCIVCMDYYNFSKNTNYFILLGQFEPIVQVLTHKLKQFLNEGFHPDRYFLFGFSFGGQLAIEAGRRFGDNEINSIDVCEPAGVGFDGNYTYNQLNPKLAAKNVQCIHTSSDKGTAIRNCHQNWNMGECGYYQISAGPPPKGSHGMCPYFYNSAFKNKFMSIRKPMRCGAPITTATLSNADYWDRDIEMGYQDNRISHNYNDGVILYANTYKYPPYNIDILTPPPPAIL